MSLDGESAGGAAVPARSLTLGLLAVVASCLTPPGALSLDLAAEELRLDNGMRLVLVLRPGAPTVAAGWVVDVGSADERPGQTGTSHFLEHLLFKGTSVVGGRDAATERRLIAELDSVHEKLARQRAARNARRVEVLERRARELEVAARDAAWPGQFSLLYSEQGAVDLDANALRDATIFHVTLPADRLELWFWLESDRLLDPVFRGFHKEKRVLREERRLRVESTPTGGLVEEAEAAFWGPDPYGRPTMGLPTDLAALTRADVRSFFSESYVAPRITAVLVGDLDVERVRELAVAYFGRLASEPPGGAAPRRPRPEAPTSPPPEPGSFSGRCHCPTQVQVRYRTVPFGHPDSYALDLLAGVLNGRSGRLFRHLVAGREIAFAASAMHTPLRRAGYFEFRGETRGEASARSLAEAWGQEAERLRREPVSPAELERARNRLIAETYRELKDPSSLLRRLLVYEGLGDWRHLEIWPERIQAVGPDDLHRVARTYLVPERAFEAVFENPADAGSDE